MRENAKQLHIYVSEIFLHVLNSEFPAKPDGEPVKNLSERHKADSKTKSTEAAKAGDEVQPSHLWQPLELWKKKHLIIALCVDPH